MTRKFSQRSKWASAFAIGLASATIAGAPATVQAGDGKPLTVGVIELFPNPHFAHARQGIRDAAKKEGVDVLIQNANLDAAKEAQYIQTFITRKVDAILLSAVSPTGSLAALKLARNAGIPVVCYTTCVNPPDDKALTQAFVKSDNLMLGTTTGRQAAEEVCAPLGSAGLRQ